MRSGDAAITDVCSRNLNVDGVQCSIWRLFKNQTGSKRRLFENPHAVMSILIGHFINQSNHFEFIAGRCSLRRDCHLWRNGKAKGEIRAFPPQALRNQPPPRSR